MAQHITMERPGFPGARSAYAGFSWTTFFFGFFPPLFRADWIGFLIGLGVWAVSWVAWSVLLGWLPWVVWAAVYNRNHFERLVSEGWCPAALGMGYLSLPSPIYQLPAPPGWYPDPAEPSRAARYWDGSAWL
ncbi:MAG: DUF2510 domain-containing protein [Propionicimonas sp.]